MTSAPASFARSTQPVPTPPEAPSTKTRSPALIVLWVTNMRWAVPYATGNEAASSNATNSGMRISCSASTRQYCAMPPSIISPINPFFLFRGLTRTRSSLFQPVTPGPTSEISPAMSRPITTGSGTLIPGMPRTVTKSWSLKDDARTRIRTWPSTTAGIGRSSTTFRFSNLPWLSKTSARILAFDIFAALSEVCSIIPGFPKCISFAGTIAPNVFGTRKVKMHQPRTHRSLRQPERGIGRVAVDLIPGEHYTLPDRHHFGIADENIGNDAHPFLEVHRGDAKRQSPLESWAGNAHDRAGVNLALARHFAPFEIAAACIHADGTRIVLEALRVLTELQHELSGARTIPKRFCRHVHIGLRDRAVFVSHSRPPGSSRHWCPNCGHRG